MDKSKTKIILIVSATFAALLLVGFLIWTYTPLIKGIIATNMYGTDKCATGHKNMLMPDASITYWTCPICHGQEETTVATSHNLKLCSMCAALTGRCKYCGKILNEQK